MTTATDPRADRDAYFKEREHKRIRERAEAQVRGHEKAIERLQAGIALAKIECVNDTQFETLMLNEIEAHKMDIYKVRRQMVLDITGARVDNHDF